MQYKKTILFVLMTFMITWGSWFAVSAFQTGNSLKPPLFILYVFGGFGPTIAAFIIKGFFCDKVQFKDFLRQLMKARVNPWWYLFIFASPLALTFLPLLTGVLTGAEMQVVVKQPLYMLFAMIPVMIIGGGLEEVGWRGVMLPELLKKHSVAASTAAVSIVWVAWHIPLWFIKGVSQYGSNFLEFTVSIVGIALLLSIVYVRTRSIFLCVLFHSFINCNAAIFSVRNLDAETDVVRTASKLIVCIGVFAVFLLMNRAKSVSPANAQTI